MSGSLFSLWEVRAVLWLSLLLQSGEASIHTEVQAGPLYRVVGSPLSISCTVSGFNSESDEKQFEFRFKKPSENEINIISMKDNSFGYAVYQARVWKKDIGVTRVSPNSVLFEIQSLRKEDEGEYHCSVVNYEDKYIGQYSAATTVKVIDNSLSVFSPGPTSMSLDRGDPLTLTCQAFSKTTQHTHLSFTWYLRRDGEDNVQPIISLDRDFTLKPGHGFKDRYQAAIIRLDKLEAATYQLNIAYLEVADQGNIYCQAQEWVQDPDDSWYPIARMNGTEITIEVKAPVMKVSLRNRNSAVTIGDNVELMCRIKGPRRAPIAVTWSLHCDTSTPDDILTVSSDGAISWFVEQHRYQVKVETRNNEEVIHYLQIIGASDNEAGSYCCGLGVHGKLHLSNPVAVNVTNQESKLVLATSSKMKENINTDIEMKCSVTSRSSAVALYDVTWLFQSENKTIVHSDRNGFVQFGPQMEPISRQRISMRRISGPSFVLTIRQAEISDRGLYICTVGEWLQNPHGDWYQLSMMSKTIQLRITEPDNDLRLDQKNQLLVTKEAEDVELKCDTISGATGPSYFYKVTWFYSGQRSSNRNVSLVKLDHTGLLSYPEDESIQNLKNHFHLSRPSHNSFILNIQTVREEDNGAYWCQVEQYQLDPQSHWKQKASDIAGPITLRVHITENNLSLAKTDREFNVSMLQDFTVPCHITQRSSNLSKFHVTWFWQKTTQSVHSPIFTVYRNFTLQSKMGKSVSLRFGHPLPGQYDLTILNPVSSGLYFCEVEEWLLSLSSGWRKVGTERSGKLIIKVHTEGNSNASSESQCHSMTWIIITVATIIISLFVILLLVRRICRKTPSGDKKPEKSLWDEQLHLKASDET